MYRLTLLTDPRLSVCRTAFASWLLMNLLLINVPRYGAYMMVVTGALMVSACALYTCLKPSRPLAIRFEDTVLNMALGWQFYLVLIAGGWSSGLGAWLDMVGDNRKLCTSSVKLGYFCSTLNGFESQVNRFHGLHCNLS